MHLIFTIFVFLSIAGTQPSMAVADKPLPKIGGDWADGFDGLISVIEQAKEAAANGDPTLLAEVRANLMANQAALRVVHRKPDAKQSFITKSQYEANVLPWGVGTNFVKDQEDRFWIIHKHMPPMRARVDGVPVFPLDYQMWEAAKLEHSKKKAPSNFPKLKK